MMRRTRVMIDSPEMNDDALIKHDLSGPILEIVSLLWEKSVLFMYNYNVLIENSCSMPEIMYLCIMSMHADRVSRTSPCPRYCDVLCLNCSSISSFMLFSIQKLSILQFLFDILSCVYTIMLSSRYKATLMNYHDLSIIHVQFWITQNVEFNEMMMDSFDSDLKHSGQEAHTLTKSVYLQIEIHFEWDEDRDPQFVRIYSNAEMAFVWIGSDFGFVIDR